MTTHPPVDKMWTAYAATHRFRIPRPDSWHFCDCEADADLCAALVLSGKKRATATSLWWYEANAKPPPDDLHIVTNWAGEAQCIIKTTDVRVVPFHDVDEAHAQAEGEGDGSLDQWRRVHWDYYHRELAGTNRVPRLDMPLVCEYFELEFPDTRVTEG